MTEENKKLTIDKEKLKAVKVYLAREVFQNGDIMHNQTIRDSGLVEIIATLYEYLNILITGESFDYMWHFANHCGSWVETNEFDEIIEDIINNKGA
jgi:hypothetical protein